MTTAKTARAQVLLTEDELAQLKTLAAKQNRSVAYVARALILSGMKKVRP